MVLKESGTWELSVDWEDEDGGHELHDQGGFRLGDSFSGCVHPEALLLAYDTCGNGQTEVQLAFVR
jgi:hypothetical protein